MHFTVNKNTFVHFLVLLLRVCCLFLIEKFLLLTFIHIYIIAYFLYLLLNYFLLEMLDEHPSMNK